MPVIVDESQGSDIPFIAVSITPFHLEIDTSRRQGRRLYRKFPTIGLQAVHCLDMLTFARICCEPRVVSLSDIRIALMRYK
jgi:hypothetical protein